MRKPPGPLVHFHSLWRWASGRVMEREQMSRESHLIAPSGSPQETLEWLEWRGYRAALVRPQREPKDFLGVLGGDSVMTGWEMIGKAGVMFGRKNQPLFLAQIGDVLVWDGENVRVEE